MGRKETKNKMGRKVYFSDNEKAHDFAQRIGTRVDVEGARGDDNYYSVDTSNAKWSKDNPYGEDPDKE